MGNTTNNRARRAATCRNFSASLQVDDEHQIQTNNQSSEISETSSSPRRSSRKRQSPRRLLSQTLVGRAKIIESEFDERGGLDQPGRNFVLDDEFKARREDEENGREIFKCYLKPAGWKDSYATDKKLDSVFVFVAGGESAKTAEEGVTMFYDYVDIWRKWKSDAEFRKMFQGGDEWTVATDGHQREKIFSPQRTGKLVTKRFKSNCLNDSAFQEDTTSDCPSIDSMELAAALGGHEPGTPITSIYKKKPAAQSPTGIAVSASDNPPIDSMDLAAAPMVEEQAPNAEAAKPHTTPEGKKKRGRPRSSSKKPPAKQVKSKPTHDDMSFQSRPEAPPAADKPSIDSAELPAALGDDEPPIVTVSPQLSEPSQAEQKRYNKLQNDKIMLQMENEKLKQELENERLKKELAALRKENGGS